MTNARLAVGKPSQQQLLGQACTQGLDSERSATSRRHWLLDNGAQAKAGTDRAVPTLCHTRKRRCGLGYRAGYRPSRQPPDLLQGDLEADLRRKQRDRYVVPLPASALDCYHPNSYYFEDTATQSNKLEEVRRSHHNLASFKSLANLSDIYR